uniref:CLAVATA3/ESR-like protein n=1 Tax=Strongyloides papillosus TaxID=174720 RepID=A0A0N5B9A5_STREA
MKVLTIAVLVTVIITSYTQISKRITMDGDSLNNHHQKIQGLVGPPIPQPKEISDHLMVREHHGQMPSLRPPPGVAGKLNMVKLRDFIALVKAAKHKRMVAEP